MTNDFEVNLQHLVEFGKARFKKYPYTEYGNELRIDDEVYALFGYVTQMKLLTDEMIDNIVAMAEHMNDNLNQFNLTLDTFLNRFDGKLKDTLTNILTEWQESGKLDVLIDESLQSEMDILEQETQTKLNDFNRQLSQVVSYINIMSYGAYDDNTHPDETTNAFKRAVLENDGGTIYVPKNGQYLINDTVVIPSNFSFISEGSIVYGGERNKPALIFNRQTGKRIEISYINDRTNEFHGWESETYIGVVFENLMRCDVSIMSVQNFTKGVQIKASGGLSKGNFFNQYNIMNISDCKISYDFFQTEPSSWINANTFKNTSFSLTQFDIPSNPFYGFANAEVNRYGIMQSFENNSYTSDSNVFENVKFDIGTVIKGTYTGVYLTHAWGWKFNDYRVEFVGNNNVKFAILDLSKNDVYGIIFKPLFETYSSTENVKVNVYDLKTGTRTNNQIYEKTGVLSNLDYELLYLDSKYNEKYSQNGDFHTINGVYHFDIGSNVLNSISEKTNEYGVGSRLIENGVRVGEYCVKYIKNILPNTQFKIKLQQAVDPQNLAIALKCFDSTGTALGKTVLEGLNNVSVIGASGLYYNESNKTYMQNTNGGYLEFTIQNSAVKTVALLYRGNINGIQIETNNKSGSVLKSIVPERNNSAENIG